MAREFDLIGLGNSLVDILLELTDGEFDPLGFEKGMPFFIQRRGSGDRQREAQIHRPRMAGTAAAHPRGFAGERDGVAKLQIRRRGDLRAQHDITIKPLRLDLEHQGPLRLGIDEWPGLPALRQIPLHLRRHAHNARKAPVSMPATIMLNPKADGEGFAGHDSSLLGDELELEAGLSE